MPTDEEILDRMRQHCRSDLSLPEHKEEVIASYETDAEKAHVQTRWNFVFPSLLRLCRVRLDQVNFQLVFSCPDVRP